MKVQPRYQLLEIWRGVVAQSFRDGKWQWGGRGGRNSISDGEQLLCILAPATSVPTFGIDEPDSTSDDVLNALRGLGNSVDIPLELIKALLEYLQTYTEDDGTPIFSGEGYFAVPDPRGSNSTSVELSAELRAQHVVDSFAVSVGLSLATVGFVRAFGASVSRKPRLVELCTEVERLAANRLSAAMVALLRSFTVFAFDADSSDGHALIRMLDPHEAPSKVLIRFREELGSVRSTMKTLTLGLGEGIIDDLDRPSMMFECGWSWGIVRGAGEIDTTEPVGRQTAGDAETGAYIHFTVMALDAIEGLLSERTRSLSLLSEEQQGLADALRTRWHLTQNYWATVATFGHGKWPLEDIPWTRTNENESDYFSLLVSSIVVRKLVRERASNRELDRVGQVLQRLAERARITYRTYKGDLAPRLHAPGVKMHLLTQDSNVPSLAWIISDFAPLLMERALSLAGLLRDSELRGRMLTLADHTWEHLIGRRLDRPRGDLWDQPENVFPGLGTRYDEPSWYFTKRVVDTVVRAAELISSEPLRGDDLTHLAMDLLAVADHLYDQEMLISPLEPGPAVTQKLQSLKVRMERARLVSDKRPAIAIALSSEVLRELDQLAAARHDSDGR
jgi:hypothetical protein